MYTRVFISYSPTQGFYFYLFLLFFFETESRQASARADEAVDHLASFLSSREEISHPGIKPPTSSLRFGYLSTIISSSLGSSRTHDTSHLAFQWKFHTPRQFNTCFHINSPVDRPPSNLQPTLCIISPAKRSRVYK